MWEDCLGLPPGEAEALLAEGGCRVVAVKFTGKQVSLSPEESRVVRVRVVGAGQVELVLSPVVGAPEDSQPPGKGGAGNHAL
ncbi:MAG: hypothetical protein ACPL5F_00445 [Moorellaceae bacterium]